MAPIIFNEEDYLGQFNEFFSARESDKGNSELIQGQKCWNFEIFDEIEQKNFLTSKLKFLSARSIFVKNGSSGF